MAILEKELFISSILDVPTRAHHATQFVDRNYADHAFHITPNRANAEKLFNDIGAYIKRGGQMGKGGRPWDIAPSVFDTLDRTKAWWGWEFETGWKTREDMLVAVGHTWDTYDGCMFDSEGEGHNAVEITFTPSEQYRYFDGTAPALQFMKWMSDNKHMTYRGRDNDVGTHLNISDPRFTNRAVVDKLTRFMNRTLKFTQRVNGQRERMFGRESIYAGFFHNMSNEGKNQWIEFKGYRTTYDYDQFQDFLKSAAALQKVVDYFFSKSIEELEGRGISNLYDIAFNGAAPRRSKVEYYNPAPDAAKLFTRHIGGGDAGSIT